MKRSVFLLTLILVVFLFFQMRWEYINVVSLSKENLLSNGNYAPDLALADGQVTEINLTNKSFVVRVNTLEGKPSDLKWLIKCKDDALIRSLISESTYHLTFTVDLNQHQYTSAKNRYAFDYDQYLFSNGINGQYFLESIQEAKRCETFCLSCLRLEIRTWIQNYLTIKFSPAQSGFLMALILGDKSQFDGYDLYKNLGLAHVFAISGLHFGIIYQYFRQIVLIKNRIIKSGIIILTMAFMLLLVGGAYSAQRAFFMILYSELAQLLHRKHDIYANLAVSLLLILLIQPVAILSTGLHLSYFAYICVAVLYKAVFKKKMKSKVLEALRFSVAIQVLLLPATLYYFQSANLFGFVSNAIIVPLSGVILPLALLMLVLGAMQLNVFTAVIGVILKLLIGIFEWVGSWLPLELDYFIHFKKSDFYILLIYLSVFALSLVFWRVFVNRRKTQAAMCVVLCIVFIFFNWVSNDDVVVSFFDVGHGDMSLIKTENLTVLIDTGDGRVDTNALLRGQGIHRIDILVLSHAHNDHIGDVVSLVTNMSVGHIYANQATLETLEAACPGIEAHITVLNTPMEWVLDQNNNQPVVFSIVPMVEEGGEYTGDADNDAYDPNDDALVCQLKYGDNVGWFLGDVSGDVIEPYFAKENQPIDFIKSAHHGSKTAISKLFYASHQIKYAFTSCNTKYNMPNTAYEAVLSENHIKHYTTYRYGEIKLALTQNSIKIKPLLNP